MVDDARFQGLVLDEVLPGCRHPTSSIGGSCLRSANVPLASSALAKEHTNIVEQWNNAQNSESEAYIAFRDSFRDILANTSLGRVDFHRRELRLWWESAVQLLSSGDLEEPEDLPLQVLLPAF